MAEALLAETGEIDIHAFATNVRRIFPDALEGYATLGRMIYQMRLERERAAALSAAGAKAGRNDPCPCGSGRKYKKCCG